MLRPERGSVFLARPFGAAFWKAPALGFLVSVRGTGTKELSRMRAGDRAELTGPLGNAWADFPAGKIPAGRIPALAGGGAGIAPLLALAGELAGNGTGRAFDFYAGFRESFACENLPEEAFLARKTVIAFEGGLGGKAPRRRGWAAAKRRPGGRLSPSIQIQSGRILDFLDPADYSAVYACGPEPMLRALAARCGEAAVPCYVSVERRMACGVGACLGCAVETSGGNRRCCADGPIFPAGEIYG
jgi:NAD(P)H-flavin reductase